LGDKSGDLNAKMWENIQEAESTVDRDDFVKVKGIVRSFGTNPVNDPQA
jgi:3'-5' exoribonuclease